MVKTVSIQGYEASFHHIAARQYFGKDIKILPCDRFHAVLEKVKDNQAGAAVMAIENSIAGSILPNYNLLQKSGLIITGEIYLPIRQHLMVNAGVSLQEVKEVHSHPMALQQCMDFLLKHRWKLVETEDTALSAKLLHQHKSRHRAVIAGKLAAEMFGLHIIAENIHAEKKNYTRFLILQRHAQRMSFANKASISFHTNHQRGSLAKVLTKIAEGGINLSKLQSLPIPGSNWEYKFYADMEFENEEQFEKTISVIKTVTADIKIFGVYKNGKH